MRNVCRHKQEKMFRSKLGQVRIIGGIWRGQRLTFPARKDLRPTPDRVRETLFNWISSLVVDARCLDLYAGSGALAFEALSRGAAHCDLIDNDRKICEALLNNVKKLSCTETTTITCMDAFMALRRSLRWDIIFLDPPFSANMARKILVVILQEKKVSPTGLIYLETPITNMPDLTDLNLNIIREKIAGKVRYQLLSPR